MKHIEFLEIHGKLKKIIDDAFLHNEIGQVSQDLLDANIFRKIGSEYKLSDTYLQYANTSLKRADATIIFGDFSNETKRLLEYKKDYLEIKDNEYLIRIRGLISKLYERLLDRDTIITTRVSDIITDNKIKLEILIKDAESVDKEVSNIVKENNEIRVLLNEELKGLTKEIDTLIIEIGFDMEKINSNIHNNIHKLSDFISRSKKRKAQNEKLFASANLILKQDDNHIESVLLSNKSKLMHTIKQSKTNVKTLPRELHLHKPSFIKALREVLVLKKTKNKAPISKNTLSFTEEETNILVLNFNDVVNDIKQNKPDDIFAYISGHSEVTKFEPDKQKNEAFLAYLTLMVEYADNVDVSESYNQENIRVSKWI